MTAVDQVGKVVDERLKSLTNFVTNTLTRAEAVGELQRQGNYAFSYDLDRFICNFCVSWWPLGLRASFPTIGSGEENVCQPFVTKVMECFVTGTVQVHDKKKKNKTIKIENIPDPYAFKKRTVEKKSPDVVFYDGMHKQGVSAITFIGEVKSAIDGEFSSGFIGQLTDGMERVMNKQPLRHYMYGFLTDGRRFLFILCQRNGKQFCFSHSSTFLEQKGWQVVNTRLVDVNCFYPAVSTNFMCC